MKARAARTGTAALGILGAGLLAAPAVLALPPGGAVDKPGTPPGTLEITNATGLREGKVQFCVRSFVTKDGGAPQQFMVKLDDFGSNGIGPFQPDASGTFCGEIATDRAAYASSASADDKLPADLCAPGNHWLRVLSGPWAHPDATERSLAKDVVVDATCGTGGKAAQPSVGTVVGRDTGVGSAPAPGTGTGGGAGSGGAGASSGGTAGQGGGGTGGPAGGTTTTPSGGYAPVVLSGLATLRSRTLRFDRRRLTVPLRRTGAVGTGKITVRTVSRFRSRGGGPARIRTLVAARRYSLTAASTTTARVALTTYTGRRLLRDHRRLKANLTITPTGGTPRTVRVVLRAAG